MNIKIIYFILFLVFGSCLISVENLDINSVISKKMNKIKSKLDSNKLDDNDETNPALQDGYNATINNMISNKVQNALGKHNTVDISSEEGTFENKVIENEPVVITNNEEGGGINNMIIIIGFILVVLYLINK
jgi:hypothetical protein